MKLRKKSIRKKEKKIELMELNRQTCNIDHEIEITS